jgi:hypothetical protein
VSAFIKDIGLNILYKIKKYLKSLNCDVAWALSARGEGFKTPKSLNRVLQASGQ